MENRSKKKYVRALEDGSVYDAETGEILQDTGLALKRAPKKQYRFGEWVAMSQAGYERVSKECSANANRVFNNIMSKMKYQNYWTDLNKSEIARDLSMSRNTVAKAITELFNKAILVDLDDGHVTLNASVAYRGSAYNQMALEKRIRSADNARGFEIENVVPLRKN